MKHPDRLPNKPRGFTLLEILIASSILVMAMTAAYSIYRSVARTQEVGHWTSMTANQLRNGLTLLRNEITRATPPTQITQQGTTPFGDPAQGFLYGPPTNPYTNDFSSGDTKLIEFFMCQPGKRGKLDAPGEPFAIPGVKSEDPEIMQGLLEIVGRKLVYRRTIISQPGTVVQKTPTYFQEICANPKSIEIKITQTPDLSVKARNIIHVTVVAQHPRYPETKVTESMEAAFEVPFQLGGYP